MAPSTAPTLTRTAPKARETTRWARGARTNIGAKQSHTTSARTGEYTTIATVATRSWPALRTSWRPPHWTKRETVSTSLVTRETSEPRRSAAWVSTDRSWTWRKVRVRSWARPRSLARKSRMLTAELATPATTTAASAGPAVRSP